MPPTPPPLAFIDRQLDNAREERQALVASFERSIVALRRDLWASSMLSSLISIVLLALIILARDGVFAKVGLPGVTVETRSASAAELPQ